VSNDHFRSAQRRARRVRTVAFRTGDDDRSTGDQQAIRMPRRRDELDAEPTEIENGPIYTWKLNA